VLSSPMGDGISTSEGFNMFAPSVVISGSRLGPSEPLSLGGVLIGAVLGRTSSSTYDLVIASSAVYGGGASLVILDASRAILKFWPPTWMSMDLASSILVVVKRVKVEMMLEARLCRVVEVVLAESRIQGGT
jgi:hypothetical protein